MIDLNTEFGRRVDQRLREEDVFWFTTVTPEGTPEPNPVWFWWDGEEFILYSKPDSYRIRNIQRNPRVSLHLQGADAIGDNVLVIRGEARLNPHSTQPHPSYAEKYQKYLPAMRVTMEELAAAYTVEIRVKPVKVRGW